MGRGRNAQRSVQGKLCKGGVAGSLSNYSLTPHLQGLSLREKTLSPPRIFLVWIPLLMEDCVTHSRCFFVSFLSSSSFLLLLPFLLKKRRTNQEEVICQNWHVPTVFPPEVPLLLMPLEDSVKSCLLQEWVLFVSVWSIDNVLKLGERSFGLQNIFLMNVVLELNLLPVHSSCYGKISYWSSFVSVLEVVE